MMTFVMALTGLVAGLFGRGLGALWRRYRNGPEAAPTGPIGDLLMEPIHWAHHRWVAPRQERRRRARLAKGALWEAQTYAAEARSAWEEWAPGWRHLAGDEPLMRSWKKLMDALAEGADSAAVKHAAEELGREVDAELQRTHCLSCGFESADAFLHRVQVTGREWDLKAQALSAALARLSAYDRQDWKFSTYPTPGEGNPVDPVWRQLNEWQPPR